MWAIPFLFLQRFGSSLKIRIFGSGSSLIYLNKSPALRFSCIMNYLWAKLNTQLKFSPTSVTGFVRPPHNKLVSCFRKGYFVYSFLVMSWFQNAQRKQNTTFLYFCIIHIALRHWLVGYALTLDTGRARTGLPDVGNVILSRCTAWQYIEHFVGAKVVRTRTSARLPSCAHSYE